MILNSDQEWFTREQDSMQERINAKHVMQEHVGRSRQRAQEKHEHVKGDEGVGGAPMSVCPCVCPCILPVF